MSVGTRRDMLNVAAAIIDVSSNETNVGDGNVAGIEASTASLVMSLVGEVGFKTSRKCDDCRH